MNKIINIFTWLVAVILLASCTFASAATQIAASPSPTVEKGSCADPMGVMKAFYDSNDAGTLDKSLSFLSDDIGFSFWAQGIQGHHMTEKFLTGKDHMRAELSSPGLVRSSKLPNGPIFHEDKIQITGNTLVYMLEPDRAHADGRPYNPYQVSAVFDGCKIKTLNVIEMVTWL
jgi:hypothetical protein